MDERLTQAEAIVFDLGNVLLRFDPDEVSLLLPEAYRAQLKEALFGKGMWSAFDLGLPDNETLARRVAEAAGCPDQAEAVLYTVTHFHEVMDELPLVRLLPALRAAGKRLYGLTNYPEPSFTLTCEAFPFLRELDGIVVSAREKVVKPSPEIFRLLARRYRLSPEKTLFIDDVYANTQTAAKEGFQVWHYAPPDCL